ncbi:MAG TPA: hypothetical protein VMM80_00815 [Bacteroidota bacterium]|nr:hypothetical protein [Bacteroidota bacterium]
MRTLWLVTLAFVCAAGAVAAHDSTAVPAGAAPDSARAVVRHRAVRPADAKKRKAPPIDVRALAALQAPPDAPALSRPAGGSRSALPLIALSLLIAGGSTALILRILARSLRKSPRAPARGAQAAGGAGRDGVPSASHCPREEDETAPLVAAGGAGADDEEDDPFYGVGKEMRSAREEFALAMRMHAAPMGDGLRRGAVEACGENSSLAERIKIARRLGVGRGEIDLALRLQKLETIVPAEEETA